MIDYAKRYFKHLDLVREDIREEFVKLGISMAGIRICDFGCGTGLTTFGLALEVERSECFGVDLFDHQNGVTPKVIADLLKHIQGEEHPQITELIETDRVPAFIKGNIVKNENLPREIDLAYCKKVLANMYGKAYQDIESGESGLRKGLSNIAACINPRGFLAAVEYDKDHILERHLLEAGFKIVRREQIKRREIRSKGRTDVISTLTLYLCQKAAQ